MKIFCSFVACLLLTALMPQAPSGPHRRAPEGAAPLPTGQTLHPAGTAAAFGGRPVDLALAPDGRTLYVKDDRGIVAIDVAAWKVRQELKFPAGGGSLHGIAVSRDGSRLYATTAQSHLHEATVTAEGALTWARTISLSGPGGKGDSHPCGLALAPDEARAYVCLSRNNSLGIVDLKTGRLEKEIPVGVAPWDVALSADGRVAYVSDWGGRRPKKGERTEKSSGTDTLVDARGVAISGAVSFVDVQVGKEVAQIETGLHPSDLELRADGRLLYVANANSDTVSVIETDSRRVVETLLVRPAPSLPFGSAPTGLALDKDGSTLYVTLGGSNAVAVALLPNPPAPFPDSFAALTGKGESNRDGRDLAPPSLARYERPGKGAGGLGAFPNRGVRSSRVLGFIPTGWYPGAVVTDGKRLFIANVKGTGAQKRPAEAKGFNTHQHLGTVNAVSLPTADELRTYTAQVRADGRVPEILRARERTESGKKPVPVPEQVGAPSVFDHVVYVIKENRTYDQVFGDMKQGNGDPSLCLFGRNVTPNHHALAEQFVLLDNFYCNGVLSADGHAWATEGNVSDYLEKSFGGFTRSYTWGDDPLSYSSTGFLWDNALLHGLSFRNYGEMDYAEPTPKGDFQAIYRDYVKKTGKFRFQQNIGIARLREFSCRAFPGWNLGVPDVLRADLFLKELRQYEKQGGWPHLVIVFLGDDHTSGTSPGFPTPRAQVADNDLALGRIVEGITKSRFWPKTCVFVVEDDPQDGLDHVDGHRSPALVISPYTKRGAVVHHFYNQTSVLHTMERLLGLPPMNQFDALAPLMRGCFTEMPDFRPYTHLANRIALDEMNPPIKALRGRAREWAGKSLAMDFKCPDEADEETLNRVLWHSVRGADAPYPAHLAGAHGRGLKALGLRPVSRLGQGNPKRP